MIIRGVVRRIDPWASLADAVTKLGLDDLQAEGESAAQFLLRFAISHPGLHTTIIGTKSLDHLADNIKAVEAGPLPDDVLTEAKRRLDAAGIKSSD
jgi:aryl-alcohol dehydrogenase-like predicted oxidoreductase